ncbi:MAG: hypothetical protein ONB42_01780 [candidate division KSB1 bacterium]|nr:hypothetical protein [candidate division KSB1 bacterium]
MSAKCVIASPITGETVAARKLNNIKPEKAEVVNDVRHSNHHLF